MIIRHQKHERSAHKVREKRPAHAVHRPGMKMVSSGQEERLRRLAYPNFRANQFLAAIDNQFRFRSSRTSRKKLWTLLPSAMWSQRYRRLLVKCIRR
jgi:hypothetical protein